MADKASTKGISLNESDWRWADERAQALKLDPRSARSDYFRMLIDLDRQFRFAKHPHRGDGRWHLYEEEPVRAVAEGAAPYGQPKPKLDEAKPPNESELVPGVGPAPRVSA